MDRIGHATRAILVDEMVAAQELHQLTRDDVKRLVVSAVEMSWLTSDAQQYF